MVGCIPSRPLWKCGKNSWSSKSCPFIYGPCDLNNVVTVTVTLIVAITLTAVTVAITISSKHGYVTIDVAVAITLMLEPSLMYINRSD